MAQGANAVATPNWRAFAPDTIESRLQGEPLAVEENDSALRVLKAFEMAARVFGEEAKALSWLRSPNRGMDSVIPIDLLESETGGMLIEQALNRIDYGIYV